MTKAIQIFSVHNRLIQLKSSIYMDANYKEHTIRTKMLSERKTF
jgi:hypothetical protein